MIYDDNVGDDGDGARDTNLALLSCKANFSVFHFLNQDPTNNDNI